MDIVILGAGALGSLFGAFLAPLANISLCCHSAAQARLVRGRGVVVHKMDGSVCTVPLAACSSEDEAALPQAAFDAAIEKVFTENKLRLEAVAGAASIDVKSDEAGLTECCRERGWPVTFHSAEALNAVAGSFTPSQFVQNTVGVDNVCERAAAASGGRIIVRKTALDGVTVAVAEEKWGIEFG